MSTIVEAAPRRVRAARGAFRGGILWIVVVGSLLAGVVAINVLVLASTSSWTSSALAPS